MRSAFLRLVLSAVFGIAAAVSAASAGAGTVEGVTMPETATVGGQSLALNGVGLRKKFVFKVYVAGLYVTTKGADAGALLDQAGPKRIAITLKRNVEADTFAKAFEEGLRERVAGEQLKALEPRMAQMKEQILSLHEVKEGDEVFLDFVPGTGTTIVHGGKPVGAAIAGDDFFKAVLGIYLGPKPIQDSLKAGLLGAK